MRENNLQGDYTPAKPQSKVAWSIAWVLAVVVYFLAFDNQWMWLSVIQGNHISGSAAINRIKFALILATPLALLAARRAWACWTTDDDSPGSTSR